MAGDACVHEVHRGGGAVLCSEARSCVLGVQKMCRRTSITEYVGWDRAFEKIYRKSSCVTCVCVRTRWLLIIFATIDIHIYNYICGMCVFSANDQ